MSAIWINIARWAAEAALALGLGLLLRRFVGLLALVRGRSMEGTLKNGEVMLAARYGLFGAPRRQDVVICRYPGRRELFVKRLIALPGETIEIEGGQVKIDGEALNEPYLDRPGLRTIEARTLGPDEYFVMGDNRPASNDSRRVGPVSRRMLLARVRVVLLPLKAARRIAYRVGTSGRASK